MGLPRNVEGRSLWEQAWVFESALAESCSDVRREGKHTLYMECCCCPPVSVFMIVLFGSLANKLAIVCGDPEHVRVYTRPGVWTGDAGSWLLPLSSSCTHTPAFIRTGAVCICSCMLHGRCHVNVRLHTCLRVRWTRPYLSSLGNTGGASIFCCVLVFFVGLSCPNTRVQVRHGVRHSPS